MKIEHPVTYGEKSHCCGNSYYRGNGDIHRKSTVTAPQPKDSGYCVIESEA